MPKQPNEPGFYERPSDKLVTELLGHELVTPAGKYLVTVTEGFNGLIRKDMEHDYSQKDREPGEICVTRFRGWPQLNVVGKEGKAGPQLTWMKKFENGKDGEVTGSTVVSDLAGVMKERLKQASDYVDFARENFDGKKLWKPRADIHIEPATQQFLELHGRGITAHPMKKEKGKKPELANAENSVGIGQLGVVEIGNQEELKRIITKEGERIGMTYDEILDPANLTKVLQKSRLLTRIIKQLENRQK